MIIKIKAYTFDVLILIMTHIHMIFNEIKNFMSSEMYT